MFGEEELVKIHKERAALISYIITAAFGLVLARLWYLQVYKGETLHNYSIQNRLRKEVVWAPRGLIYSRDDQLLVDNIPRFDAILTPQFLMDKEETLGKLSKMLSMDIESINTILKKNSNQAKYRPIIVKKNISFGELAQIETQNADLPGVSVDTFISREYRDKEIGAHLLGYISEISQTQLPKLRERDHADYRLGDFIGQFGIEEQLDKYLRGENGHEFVEVDARGRRKRYINTDNLFKGIEDEKPLSGMNVKLTIDRDMQIAAFNALQDKVGGVIAIDINSGQVLAMVSRPSFDPSQFSRGLTPEYWRSLVGNKEHPLRDRNIQEHFSPGSTFKAITGIAAFEEGEIDENTEVNCGGSFRLGRKVYHCWKKEGHGPTNLVKAIRESCNVYFQKAANRMDIDAISKYAKAFGLGARTGISLPREVSGLIPTKEWKKKRFGQEWQAGETLSCAIGQSYVLASTIQLATAYAAIANGGKIYRPYVVKDIYDTQGELVKTFTPELLSSFEMKNPKTLKFIREGLFQVVNSPKGTAFYRRGQGILMAGKTGTSQVKSASADKVYAKCENMDYESRHHGLFVGFAPADNPKIAAAVIVEHGCHGSSAATPVAEAVITQYMKKYHPDLYLQNLEKDKEIRDNWVKSLRAAQPAKPKPAAEPAEE
ncbi:penicillin-binding protein 2 [Peredibacter sp. HCB2-198]|uniref:penicillin-binding protein 2 n=1 Tax=Peredibacter sp. HCB2-198 TaxID=3383025 RepID=UPI0038B56B90